jgi:putative DNA methylase
VWVTGARKLIETAFPVEVVGRHASREKSIRHGHPSTLHLWWSRKPLAAARAVLLAQLIDDPSARPDLFPQVEQQDAERARLLDLIGRTSAWEATADPLLMAGLRAELTRSCGPDLPLLWDPFAGGGSIPLEGQRLGLPVLSTDLNPVAVLLQRALLELPRRWRDRPAVSADQHRPGDRAAGLAADLRHFGVRVAQRAAERLAPLYPPVVWAGAEYPVAAYLWVRTVPCGDPVCDATVPMLSNPWLSRRPGREAWLQPAWQQGRLSFRVMAGDTAQVRAGRGSVFGCLACGTLTAPDDVKSIAADRGLGRALRCVVPDAGANRPFLVLPESQVCPPVDEHPVAGAGAGCFEDLPLDPAVSNAPSYGVRTLADLQLPRQRVAMAEFAAQVRAATAEVAEAAVRRGWPADQAEQYATDVTLLLGLVLGRLANRMSTACIWNAHRGLVEQTFIQNNAIAFPWDFAEANPLSAASGSWPSQLDWVARVIERCDPAADATVRLADARAVPALPAPADRAVLVSTDPPYFDYFLYSSLSDYFYAWLRPALHEVAPDLFAAAATPRAAEIVARSAPGPAAAADGAAFLEGLARSLARIASTASPDYPITFYYAYRATVGAAAATAWESFLAAVQAAGLVVTATWPIRTERTEGVKTGRNSLASSIVVVCRRRQPQAGELPLVDFIAGLRRVVPAAVERLQHHGIAPVDLDQAALGQGMALYTEHSRIVAPDGSLPVRAAVGLVDQVVSEALAAQRLLLDRGSRGCLEWFERYGFGPGPAARFPVTDPAERAVLASTGALDLTDDLARLLSPTELTRFRSTSGASPGPSSGPRPGGSFSGQPATDAWTAVLWLAGTLAADGAAAASGLAGQLAGRVDLARCQPLVYLLYRSCHRRNLPRLGAPFNGLGAAWRELVAITG